MGLAALDACREREVDAYALYPAVLEALVRCERLEDASVLADEGRALYDSAEVDGLERLRLEEALARHALARGAPEAFHRAALRIAEHCRLGHAAPLRARYERLLAEADRRGVPVRGDLRLSEEGARGPGASASVAERLRACADALERARCALCVLLECTGATGGYLYRLRGGDLELLARRAEQDAPASLVGVLERLVLEERAQHDVTGTLSLSFAQTVNPASDFEQDGDFLRPHLLLAQRAGQTVVAGVAALRYAEAPRRLPDWGRLNELANALLESAQPGA